MFMSAKKPTHPEMALTANNARGFQFAVNFRVQARIDIRSRTENGYIHMRRGMHRMSSLDAVTACT